MTGPPYGCFMFCEDCGDVGSDDYPLRHRLGRDICDYCYRTRCQICQLRIKDPGEGNAAICDGCFR